jgi:hypothetical protein
LLFPCMIKVSTSIWRSVNPRSAGETGACGIPAGAERACSWPGSACGGPLNARLCPRHDQAALKLGKPASTVSISLPCGVVLSAQASVSERKPAPS